MILSGRDIEWYIKAGKLEIYPTTPEQFRENGIDLILEEIEGHPQNFEKNEFVLGSTREIISMPDDLMGFVELRSTWARSGIMIPPTIVDAGFKGNLTLEIVPHKAIPVPYGKRFAHLIFAKLTNPSIPYAGTYQGQRGITIAKREKYDEE